MSKSRSCYPKPSVDTSDSALASQSGAIALIRTPEETGLTRALSKVLFAMAQTACPPRPGQSCSISRCPSPSVGTASQTSRPCANIPRIFDRPEVVVFGGIHVDRRNS